MPGRPQPVGWVAAGYVRVTEPGFNTLAIHAGQEPDPLTGAVVVPIYQTSTYKQDGVGGLRGGYEYSRSANPTRTALEECLAALEGGARGLAFASGLAAEDALLRAVCVPGDHVILPGDAYGGTFRLVARVFERWGLTYSAVPLDDLDAVRAAVRDTTRVIWCETPTNPLLGIADIAALASIAHDAGALLSVDNTFASPYLQQPLALGADVVVHSTTKYLGGHSDVVGGALVAALGRAGGAARVPPERDGCGRRAVRRLAGAARHQDARRADGPALQQLRPRRRGAVRARRGQRGALPGSALASRARGGRAADERLRRHGLLPGPRRPGRGAAGLPAGAGLHPGRVPRRGRIADRAPGPDDPRQRYRLAARGAGRPGAPVGRHRGRRGPAGRPGPGPA